MRQRLAVMAAFLVRKYGLSMLFIKGKKTWMQPVGAGNECVSQIT